MIYFLDEIRIMFNHMFNVSRETFGEWSEIWDKIDRVGVETTFYEMLELYFAWLKASNQKSKLNYKRENTLKKWKEEQTKKWKQSQKTKNKEASIF